MARRPGQVNVWTDVNARAVDTTLTPTSDHGDLFRSNDPGPTPCSDVLRHGGAKGSPKSSRRGFTLIEAALATVIIGVGVVAIIEAHESFMQSNNWSSHAATGALLGNEIREFSARLDRHDPVTGLFIGDDGDGGNVLMGWGMEASEITVDDIDDIDDLSGLTFGATGDFPGPIDALGFIIPQALADGTILLDAEGEPVPMEGWTQRVVVQKVNPNNISEAVPNDAQQPPSGTSRGRAVDQYPLRVTVIVEYQGPFDTERREITRVRWIVP